MLDKLAMNELTRVCLSLFFASTSALSLSCDEKKPAPAKVPDGHARFVTTRQKPANEKGFVGFETVWEPLQKEAEYETPKKP